MEHPEDQRASNVPAWIHLAGTFLTQNMVCMFKKTRCVRLREHPEGTLRPFKRISTRCVLLREHPEDQRASGVPAWIHLAGTRISTRCVRLRDIYHTLRPFNRHLPHIASV